MQRHQIYTTMKIINVPKPGALQEANVIVHRVAASTHGSRDAIVRIRLNEVAKRNKKNAENAERTDVVQIKMITQRHATECGRCLKVGLDECRSRKRRIVRLRGVTIRNKEINRQYDAQS